MIIILQIGHHLQNHDEKDPLFHRVIMESGAPTARAVSSYDAPLYEAQFKEFINRAGCSEVHQSSIMECLRSQSENTITMASIAVYDEYDPSIRWPFQPVIDGDLIKCRPTENWLSGRWNKVPILTGFNHDEGTIFVPKTLNTSSEFLDFFKTLSPQFSDEDLETINELYPDPARYPDSPYVETRPINVGSQFKRIAAAYAHYAYVCAVRYTATLAS